MPLYDSASLPTPPPAPPKVSVLVVVGTRPEAIKLIPIILALRASKGFRPVVVSTGQHDRMVREVFRMAGIWADVNVWIGNAQRPGVARADGTQREWAKTEREPLAPPSAASGD